MATERTKIAATIAPATATLAFWGINYVLLGWLSPHPEGAAGDSLFYVMFFGLPITYAVSGLLAVPAYFYLRDRGRLTSSRILIAAALIGLVTTGLPSAFAIQDPGGVGFFFSALGVGALSGLVGGAVFVLIASPFEGARSAS